MRPVRPVPALVPALLGGAGALLAALATVVTGAPAAAATTPCVGVVVDGRLAGGEVRTGCAKGDPDDGLEALTKAGFSYAFVPRQPGLVCQVDGFPACSATSTETYWSYWYRAKGSSRWVYATQGAGSHDPEPGSTEAWVWQDGGRREPPGLAFATVCPQAAATRTPSPDRPSPDATTQRPSRRASATGGSPPAGSPSSPASPSSPPAATASARSGTPEPSPSDASATPPATTTPAGPLTTDPTLRAEPAASRGGDGAPPWTGLAVGAALVAGLAGAAWLRARRRAS